MRHEDKDIIEHQPFAPEGTAKWAWQMMLLGRKVGGFPGRPDRHLSLSDGIITDTSKDVGNWTGSSEEEFLRCASDSGWELYVEKDDDAKPYKPVRCPKCGRFGSVCKRCGGDA